MLFMRHECLIILYFDGTIDKNLPSKKFDRFPDKNFSPKNFSAKWQTKIFLPKKHDCLTSEKFFKKNGRRFFSAARFITETIFCLWAT